VLPAVSAAVEAGHYGVGRLWRQLGAVAVCSDNSLSLLNVNTSEDLRRWRHAAG
jgi:molybdopterin-guanine dinucleotide biosynthesis protein A